MKYKYGNHKFWCMGYDVSTIGKNEKAICEYIQNQLGKDYAEDQMSLKKFTDSFTGQQVKKCK